MQGMRVAFSWQENPAGWYTHMHISTEPPDDARAGLAATVRALSQPSAYPYAVSQVETIETHMSWVFLTQHHAYKLKKPIRTDLIDHSSVELRRRACENELALNRRLSPDVYLAVVPLVRTASGLRLERAGEPQDFLVKMRRLSRERMLDSCIAASHVEPGHVTQLASVLTAFYFRTERAPMDAPRYLERITQALASTRASLRTPRYGLDAHDLEAVCAAQDRWLSSYGPLLSARAASVVDAHGDLRPEHVCLEPGSPKVIDCLEFSRDLRLLDPISELSFLSLECRRLGAAWIGERLLAQYADYAETPVPPALVAFHQSYHALIRAALAVWHLDDPVVRDPERWRARGNRYLELAREIL